MDLVQTQERFMSSARKLSRACLLRMYTHGYLLQCCDCVPNYKSPVSTVGILY